MADKKVKAVVIGAGPGGYVCAIRLAQRGVDTLCVERGELGGVCLNWGCIPSKAFIHVANLYEEMRHAETFGITAGDLKLDTAKLHAWKESVVKKLTGGIGQLFKANKVERVVGEARFRDANTLVVKNGGEETEVAFEHAVIATGGRPIEIPGFKLTDDTILDARMALGLSQHPKRLVIIGGGVIGIEMATFFAKFGVEVTVVEMLDSILTGVDPELIRVVSRHLKKRGVQVLTGAKAKSWKRIAGAGLEVTVEHKGEEKQFNTDKILLSVGVRPNSETLDLQQAGVQVGEQGFINVDAQCRTNVSHIHAIGDVTGGPLLAHKASKQGLIAAEVISGKDVALDVRAMPAAIFSDPEIATVGLSEDQATQAGHQVKIGRFPFAASGKALAMAQGDGFVKIVSDAQSDRLLGMHIVGPNAADLIAEGALAIEMGATVEDIALTVHTHPTLPEAIMEAAENVHGLAVHTINR